MSVKKSKTVSMRDWSEFKLESDIYFENMAREEIFHDRALLHDQLDIPVSYMYNEGELDYIRIAQIDVAERYPEISYEHILESQLPKGTIIGTWAYSIPGKRRYILARDLEMVTGVLPGDVTRTWLKDAYELPLKRRKNQLTDSYPSPLRARVGHWGECCYIDIKKAYVRVLSLGYDLEYIMGRYLSAMPKPVPSVIIRNKLCYAMAVSMSHNAISSIDIMGKKGRFTTHPFNNYSNPCLYNLALDTLACIAGEIIDVCGEDIKYANTDGFIVPVEVMGTVQHIIESWGFTSKVKHQGETTVWGVGSYKCGGFSTKRRDDNSTDLQSDLPTAQERKWLKYQWTNWSRYIQVSL